MFLLVGRPGRRFFTCLVGSVPPMSAVAGLEGQAKLKCGFCLRCFSITSELKICISPAFAATLMFTLFACNIWKSDELLLLISWQFEYDLVSAAYEDYVTMFFY